MYEYARDGEEMFILWCSKAIWVLYMPLIKYVMFFFGKEGNWVFEGHVVNNII